MLELHPTCNWPRSLRRHVTSVSSSTSFCSVSSTRVHDAQGDSWTACPSVKPSMLPNVNTTVPTRYPTLIPLTMMTAVITTIHRTKWMSFTIAVTHLRFDPICGCEYSRRCAMNALRVIYHSTSPENDERLDLIRNGCWFHLCT